MKIILTNHSKQRRKHYAITPDGEIIPWIKYFDDIFDFNSREDAVYKVSYKQRVAIIKKENNKLIVITIRGFTDFQKRDSYILEIRNEDIINKHKIYRVNYLNEMVSCGFIDGDTFTLKRNLEHKYQMPYFSRKQTVDDLSKFVSFNEKEKKWFLNEFERNSEDKIWRIRENGILVSCGRLVNGRAELHNQLINKFVIDPELFFKRRREILSLINYNKARGKWMLNDFTRRKK